MLQALTIRLEGISSDDYLTWVRDPEPAALGRDLQSVAARAEPLSDRIDVQLRWRQEPPSPPDAAAAAGFPLTPNVTELRDNTPRNPPATDQDADTNARRPPTSP